MKAPSRLLAVAASVGLGLLAGCPNDTPYLAKDDASVVEPDAAVPPATLTRFVIDLITNHGSDPAPVDFDQFKDLPDPDGLINNTTAYDGLFQ